MPKKQSTTSKKARRGALQGAKFTTAPREHSQAAQGAEMPQAQCANSRESPAAFSEAI
ncbi:hypothetical protein [Streptomyces sp. NPDC059649]|uniref:hypothetical protein n=1 Tax=Streptomyces sp. NPDC059649 TaxID=3346895 RepID=UPI00367CBEF1